MLQQVNAFWLRSLCLWSSSSFQHDHGDDHHDEDDDEDGDEDDGEDSDPVGQLALQGSEGKHFEHQPAFSAEFETTNAFLSVKEREEWKRESITRRFHILAMQRWEVAPTLSSRSDWGCYLWCRRRKRHVGRWFQGGSNLPGHGTPEKPFSIAQQVGNRVFPKTESCVEETCPDVSRSPKSSLSPDQDKEGRG